MSLKGKAAIVTGSATGIGAAAAVKLAEQGANVLVNYTKSEAEAKATLERCKAAGAKAVLCAGDVSRDADCRAIAKAAKDAFGRIDILVNNAGTTKFADHADLEALSAEDFARIYSVNVIGAYQMIRAAAPELKAHKQGAIVNVSSVAGILGMGSSVAYCASKGALNTMTLSLARSLAPEIRVNAVCPGFVATRWFAAHHSGTEPDDLVKLNAESAPLKRTAYGEDIADVIAFFASDAARHVTGETLLVDGGYHLNVQSMVRR